MLSDKVGLFVRNKKLIAYGDKIVIGLSGGADSVCLFRMLISMKEEYNLSLYAVHVNHGIRGEEAQRDEDFVKELAGRYKIPLTCMHYNVVELAKEMNMTTEEAGRHVRYEAFERERIKRAAAKIAVAHHMNDQAETILFRMARGTGIKGLLGMDAKRDRIIRPLLCLKKEEIIRYLNDIGQIYMEDATNESTDYDRNRIRHKVIPELELVNDNAVRHIWEMSDNLRQIYDWFGSETDVLYEKYVSEKDGSSEIQCKDLFSIRSVAAEEIVRRMIYMHTHSLKDITMQHIDSVIKLAEGRTGRIVNLPYGLCAEKEYDTLIIRKNDNIISAQKETEYTISEEEIKTKKVCCSLNNIYLPAEGVLRKTIDIEFALKKYCKETMDIPKNNCTKWFDYDRIKSNLKIRNSSEDDYFSLRSGGRKKLTRYMIDCKIPRKYRNSIMTVVNDNNIVWVIGGRAGEDYYVDDNTETVLEIIIK